jgi:hypothetical protein
MLHVFAAEMVEDRYARLAGGRRRELMTTRPFYQPGRDVLRGICAEVDAIAKRATETRWRLQHGEAVTGLTDLIDIENHCRDALALFDSFDPP